MKRSVFISSCIVMVGMAILAAIAFKYRTKDIHNTIESLPGEVKLLDLSRIEKPQAQSKSKKSESDISEEKPPQQDGGKQARPSVQQILDFLEDRQYDLKLSAAAYFLLPADEKEGLLDLLHQKYGDHPLFIELSTYHSKCPSRYPDFPSRSNLICEINQSLEDGDLESALQALTKVKQAKSQLTPALILNGTAELLTAIDRSKYEKSQWLVTGAFQLKMRTIMEINGMSEHVLSEDDGELKAEYEQAEFQTLLNEFSEIAYSERGTLIGMVIYGSLKLGQANLESQNNETTNGPSRWEFFEQCLNKLEETAQYLRSDPRSMLEIAKRSALGTETEFLLSHPSVISAIGEDCKKSLESVDP